VAPGIRAAFQRACIVSPKPNKRGWPAVRFNSIQSFGSAVAVRARIKLKNRIGNREYHEYHAELNGLLQTYYRRVHPS
jgi:hypothetical protein